MVIDLKKIIYLFYSIFLSSIIYYLSVDFVLPRLSYNNVVEFDLAYVNFDEQLLVYFKEKNARMHEVRSIGVESSQYLRHFSLQVPYVYNPSFYLGFGESKKVSFAISNFKINGVPADINQVENEFTRLGFETLVKDNVVYVQPSSSVINEFNVYNISNKFINLTHEELNESINNENYLRMAFSIFIFILLSFVLLFIHRKFLIFSFFWFKNYIIFSLILHIALFAIAMVLPRIDHNDISSLKIGMIILKNYLFIALVPVFLLALSMLFRSKCIKIGILIFSLLFMILVGVDHFAQVVFSSRYFIDTTAKFATSLLDGIPFFLNYLRTYSGFYYILSVIMLVITFFAIFRQKLLLKTKYFFTLCYVLIISFCGILFFNNNQYSQFYNVIQVNVNGLFTDGDYKRDYNRYKPFSVEQLEYKTYKGLDQRKSVIVLLIESLGCNVTYLCGNSKNYSPYINQLAEENVWFPNYYSNNYHTNGALFTITTGLPLINGPHGENTFYNKNLYTHDLISRFASAGYETRYYTPASPVLNKKQQLEMSNYSNISTVNDAYYKGKEKKGVFNSVTDEEMFNKIIDDLKSSSIPKFYMLTTISTHTPYITPWGANDVKQAFSYTDMVLKKFIEQLKDINYFDNGIVIITGDHIGWGIDNSAPNISSLMQSQQLPFILINGKEHGVIKSNVSFSHSSLGVMLEYLMLPEYKMNKFQINPIATDEQNEIILHYNANNANMVMLKKGDREDQILLDGDQTRFLGNKFSKDEQDEILGYISYVRQ